MGRLVDSIIIHCADSKPSMDVGVVEIRKWHIARGWSDIGYHYVIRKDGTVEVGRPLEIVGAHCKGHNKHSVGICWVGGYDGLDDRTEAQKIALEVLILEMQDIFKDITVHGHNEYSNKTCPNFNVNEEYASLLVGFN